MNGRWERRRSARTCWPALTAADIHPQTVAIGPWWRTGGQDEIDAVVLAGRSRTPVLVGAANSAADLRFAICAREHVVDPPPAALTVTAADIFAAR